MKPKIYSLLRKNIISIIILCLIYSNNCLSQNAELRIPIGHYGQITDLQESPDGKLLASASADGTIKIWNYSKRTLLKTLTGHKGVVTTIAFSDDGKKLVSGSVDKTVRIWDLMTGEGQILGRQSDKSVFVAFSPNSESVISVCFHTSDTLKVIPKGDFRKLPIEEVSKILKIWNIDNGEEEIVSKHRYVIKFYNPVLNIRFQKKESRDEIKALYHEKQILSFSLLIHYGKKKKSINLPTFESSELLSGNITIENDKFEHQSTNTNKWTVVGIKTGEVHIFDNSKTISNADLFSKSAFEFKEKKAEMPVLGKKQKFQLPTINQLKFSEDESILAASSFFSDTLVLYNLSEKKINRIRISSGQQSTKYPSYYPDANIIEKVYLIAADEVLKTMKLEKDDTTTTNFKTKDWVTQVLFKSNSQEIVIGYNNGKIKTLNVRTYKMGSEFNIGLNNSVTSGIIANTNTAQIGLYDGTLKSIDLGTGSVKNLKYFPFSIKTFFQTDIDNKEEFIVMGRNFDIHSTIRGKIYGNEEIRDEACSIVPMKYKKTFILGPRIKVNSTFDTTRYLYRLLSYDGKITDSIKIVSYVKLQNFNDESLQLIMNNIFNDLNSDKIIYPYAIKGGIMKISTDNKFIADIGVLGTELSSIDLETKKRWAILSKKFVEYTDVIFDSKPSSIVASTLNGDIVFWNWESDSIIKISPHNIAITYLERTENDSLFASGDNDGNIILWDLPNRLVKHKLSGHSGTISALVFSKDNKWLLSGSSDGKTKIWDTSTGKELATFIAVDSTNWVIISPEGYFDASPDAMRKMYYEQGLETFDLEQLKERYWQPELLPQLLGFKPKIFDENATFPKFIPLPPTVNLSIKGESLNIALQARNGGVGKVSLFLNGREIVEDLRKNGKDDADKKALGYRFNMSSPFIKGFLEPDIPNIFKVIAYERNDEISTSGDTISFVSQKLKAKSGIGIEIADKSSPKEEAKTKNMSFYAIVIGANTLGLRYADTDARAFKSVLENTAKQFIDTTKGNKIDIRLFCSSQTNATLRPTRVNILNYLRYLTTVAKKEDYFCFYFSGHGKVFESISKSSKTAKTDFAMLLQGVNSATKLDKNLSEYVRQNLVITMRDELVPLLNAIPARKQVHCVDACGSEQAALLATNGEKDILLSKEKAFDNMKSRTGRYFLASSAKDKVSYENSTFQHGFMTYTLLQGLNSDRTIKYFGKEAYLDVASWFKYAESETPKLAASVGQVQIPKFWTPSQQNEDIFLGIVNDELRKQISLPTNSMIQFSGYSNFQQLNSEDPLNLSDKFKGYLREKSESDPSIFMYDENPSINSYALRGTYRKENEKIIFENIGLFKNKTRVKELGRIEKQNVDELIKELFETLIQSIK